MTIVCISSYYEDNEIKHNFDLLFNTLEGMVKRLVWKVLKPILLRASVRYLLTGAAGIWNKSPIMYSGLFASISVTTKFL